MTHIKPTNTDRMLADWIVMRTDDLFDRLAEHSPLRTPSHERIDRAAFMKAFEKADRMPAVTDATAEAKCEALTGILPCEAECWGADCEAETLLDLAARLEEDGVLGRHAALYAAKYRLQRFREAFSLMTGEVGPSWRFED